MYNISWNCQISHDFYLKLLIELFEDKKGFFIDVGAADGEDASNTSCLAYAGWQGMMLEPLLRSYNICKDRYANYKDIEVLNIAASNQTGQKTLYCNSALSTLECGAPLDRAGRNSPRSSVFCTTIDKLLEDRKINNVDLISIDVEGHEKSVLEGFSLQKYNPHICIVELHAGKNPESNLYSPFVNKDIVDFARQYFDKYDLVYEDHINSIYRKKS